MASLIPSILSRDPHTQIFFVGATVVFLVALIFATTWRSAKYDDNENPSPLTSFLRFFYASFLKPHNSGEGVNGQQDALESFYKAQAGVYDNTRKRLLRGREDMLGLVAAQLVQKAAKDRTHDTKRIWVDVRVPSSSSLWIPFLPNLPIPKINSKRKKEKTIPKSPDVRREHQNLKFKKRHANTKNIQIGRMRLTLFSPLPDWRRHWLEHRGHV